MKIYIMRHGLTVWNEKNIHQGRSKNRLSKAGIKATNLIAQKYFDEKFDVIFCSPLMRAVQTANIMNKLHNKKIIKDYRLIEIDQGIFTGRKKDSLTEQEKKIKTERNEKYGLETYESVYKRAKEFINEILLHNKYNSVLIITHNCVATILSTILENKQILFDDKSCRQFTNSTIKMFEVDK